MIPATLRLLIIHDSRSEAERLISLLRNAGRQVRAQWVESEEALVKLLQEASWDLLVVADSAKVLSASDAIKQVRRLARDVPVILLTEEEAATSVVEGLKLGAADVVCMDEDQHLLLVINREVTNREERQGRRYAERRLKEIERRNQQLLDSSRDGIAFEEDGMFLYVNDSFAEILGYSSREDLESLPIIDVIADAQQDEVKAFLREFKLKSDDIDTATTQWDVADPEGSTRALNFEVRKALYDDETCVQLVVKPTARRAEQQVAQQMQQIRNQDVITGLFNRHHLVEQLEQLLARTLAEHSNSALISIEVEDFLGIVQTRLGVAAADIALGTIAAHLRTLCQPDEVLCRYSDDCFMLLIANISADAALERAEIVCRNLRDNIVSVGDATLMFGYLVGIGLVNDTTVSAETPIAHAIKALELMRKERAQNKNLLARLYEPEIVKASQEREHSEKQVAQMVQKALDQGRFKLLFQPILSLRGSDKEHYEVLLRMRELDNEDLTPAEFFGVAEQMGAMVRIDRWVILESIKLLAEHRAKGHPTRMIIHLSESSIKDKSLAPWLAVAFKAAKLTSDGLIFQLNEVDVNNNLNHAKELSFALQALGCDVCINHFGCVLHPFAVLAHLAANFVKVDGSFTQELQSGHSEPKALSDLVGQLHQLEKITIVPFVENASVLSKLWQSGVHFIQGYYLQGPAESMDFNFDTEN
jgi:diguanylate cyclase (GGDEF)-like protein/PAS domain S-box-containing protein